MVSPAHCAGPLLFNKDYDRCLVTEARQGVAHRVRIACFLRTWGSKALSIKVFRTTFLNSNDTGTSSGSSNSNYHSAAHQKSTDNNNLGNIKDKQVSGPSGRALDQDLERAQPCLSHPTSQTGEDRSHAG